MVKIITKKSVKKKAPIKKKVVKKKAVKKAAAAANPKWKMAEVSVADIAETKVNANKMSDTEFKQLVANVKKSGLSSVIACYLREEDGKYVIISGNHRFKACVTLGYSKINILYADEKDLTPDEIIAVQLSHNTLHGSDDKNILADLLAEIDSIDFREFAFVNTDTLMADESFSASIVPVSEHYSVNLILYRDDVSALQELLGMVEEGIATSDIVLMGKGDTSEEQLIDLLHGVKSEHKIKSTSVAFSKIIELAREQLTKSS